MSEISGRAGEPIRRMAGELLPPAVADLAAGPLAEALDRAMKLAHASVSARTARAYADCWDHFCAWCESHGAAYLPADPAIVGAYLAERSRTVGRSSLRVSLAALAYYHRRSGQPWASNHPIIASVTRSYRQRAKVVSASPTKLLDL